jgi:hypothetical protein
MSGYVSTWYRVSINSLTVSHVSIQCADCADQVDQHESAIFINFIKVFALARIAVYGGQVRFGDSGRNDVYRSRGNGCVDWSGWSIGIAGIGAKGSGLGS